MRLRAGVSAMDQPAVVQRIRGLQVEWLRSQSPLCWTVRRHEAHVFDEIEEADALARELTTQEVHVFPAEVEQRRARTLAPALFGGFRRGPQAGAHDWRNRRDCGLD